MKEAVVAEGPKVQIIDSPIPTPQPGQVVIKVVFSGSNPKDWKSPKFFPTPEPLNQGDDIAGTIHSLGDGVSEFKIGDRVAAFHEMRKPHGSYAEYAVAWAYTTFLLPPNTSFQGGAAIPLAALTAGIGLYANNRLNLPAPWAPATTPTPLIIYGASSAVGSYAVQFAKKSNIHPLICIAGRAQEHVQKMIDPSRGDAIVDYRKGDEAVVQGIKDALKGQEVKHAFDAVSEKGSFVNISKILSPSSSRITLVLPPPSMDWSEGHKEIPENIKQSSTMVGDAHGSLQDMAFVLCRFISRGLEQGWFQPHPQEVVPGGLGGVQTGLDWLKEGKASAVKYVFEIAQTQGVGLDNKS